MLCVFFAACLGAWLGAHFVKEDLLDRSSGLRERNRKLEKLNSDMLEEIVAADLVLHHVQLGIAGAAHVDEVGVRNALLPVFRPDSALAIEINPPFPENVVYMADDSSLELLLGIVLD